MRQSLNSGLTVNLSEKEAMKFRRGDHQAAFCLRKAVSMLEFVLLREPESLRTSSKDAGSTAA